MHPVQEIVRRNKAGREVGIFSCCSANRDVVKAVLRKAQHTHTFVLIESTSNQVNQEGGYTGMTPQDFADFVYNIADSIDLAHDRILLGGDHLGPLPWADLPEDEAMERAAGLVQACVLAGYSKIHLDTSMRVGSDDPHVALDVAVCARRGAYLCEKAEEAFAAYKREHPDAEPPVYVLGSEVPIPGGDTDADAVMGVTTVEDGKATIEAFEQAFAARGLQEPYRRVVGYVMEMGVEFHERTLDEYDREAARDLCDYMRKQRFAIEGHSTDYQTPDSLKQMCADGVSILKVGPAFTFAMREALFALSGIENRVYADQPTKKSYFREVLTSVMRNDNSRWRDYYSGNEKDLAISLGYSFYDRSRYYMPHPEVVEARQKLLDNLSGDVIPLCVLSQYLPVQYHRVRAGEIPNDPEAILLDRIGDCVDEYLFATKNNGEL